MANELPRWFAQPNQQSNKNEKQNKKFNDRNYSSVAIRLRCAHGWNDKRAENWRMRAARMHARVHCPDRRCNRNNSRWPSWPWWMHWPVKIDLRCNRMHFIAFIRAWDFIIIGAADCVGGLGARPLGVPGRVIGQPELAVCSMRTIWHSLCLWRR